MTKAAKKAPAKKSAAKKKVTRRRVTKPIPVEAKPSSHTDKVMDLIKWVDSPFKLAVIVTLGVLSFAGYLVYQNQEKLLGRVLNVEHTVSLVSDDRIIGLSQALMRDVRAETIIVHEINLSSNARVTRVALSSEGRNTSLEGKKGAFFSGSPARNHAAVSMLNGEVLCETFEPSSEAGDWLISKGVTYACRGSVPPEQGSMVGYISVGFKSVPRDLVAIKARINQTTKDLAR